MEYFTMEIVGMVLVVLGITAISEYLLIKLFRARQVGQYIREEGPEWHRSKAGTPIMGGLGFILATLIVMAIFFVTLLVNGTTNYYIPLAITLAFAVTNGAIGFVDDYAKLVKKENEGLSEMQKLLLQTAVAAGFLCVMGYTGNIETEQWIPFTDISIDFGWFYYPIALLVIVGVVNGSNFTDGLDGLEGSVTLVIGVFFAIYGFEYADERVAIVGGLLIGGCLGFLIFNFHPAKIFMGDTGSLFLGAMVIGTSIVMNELIIGIILCGVYIIEMLSSLLQRVCYKLFNKMRLFRMAPLHHHFEKCGWNEYTVVTVFSIAEALFCILAWYALYV
ncbi:MAG: phospho-N-acetylmuramoyl-pentapeptide-transferase [Clostridia bacterium]|nr:phospho-N-acetylmuramoyl-pentapeptide-transferase [Clostridia bacterium]